MKADRSVTLIGGSCVRICLPKFTAESDKPCGGSNCRTRSRSEQTSDLHNKYLSWLDVMAGGAPVWIRSEGADAFIAGCQMLIILTGRFRSRPEELERILLSAAAGRVKENQVRDFSHTRELTVIRYLCTHWFPLLTSLIAANFVLRCISVDSI